MSEPNSFENEKICLGCVLISDFDGKTNKNLIVLMDILPTPDYFYNEKNYYIYETMLELHNKGITVDIATVAEKLDKQKDSFTGNKKLEAVGGTIYLSSLADTIPSTVNFEDYAYTVKEMYVRRKLIDIERSLANELKTNFGLEALEILSKSQKEKDKILQLKIKTTIWTEDKMLKVIGNKLEQIMNKKNIYINTGIRAINELHILKKGQFIILGALPGVGKSALLIQLAVNLSKIYPNQIHILISAEMTVEGDVAWRIFCCRNNIKDMGMYYPHDKFKKMLVKYDRNIDEKNDNILVIDEISNIDKLKSVLMYLKLKLANDNKKIGNVFVDFFQAFDSASKRTSTNDYLYNVAKEINNFKKPNMLDCNVWLASQLWQKDIETKGLREPRPSDIRNCPSAFDWVDKCCFLHWEDYNVEEHKDDDIRHVKFINAKGRNWKIQKSMYILHNAAAHQYKDINNENNT